MTTSSASRNRYDYNLALKWLFMAFNSAHGDILQADDITAMLATPQADVYEVELWGEFSRAILTVELAAPFLDAELEILDFKVQDIFPSDVVFSYDHDQPDAGIIRMMTCWLEDSFLVHRAKIVERIRAMHEDLASDSTGQKLH